MIRLHRLLGLSGFALLTLAAAGCAQSLNPLSDEKTSVLDERAIGVWEIQDKEQGEGKYTVERKEGAKNTLQVTIQEKPGAEPKPPLVAYTTKIGAEHYVSLGGAKEGEPLTYVFLKYDISEDGKGLTLYPLNNEVLEKAVTSKQLKGQIKKQDYGSYTLLEDTTDAIVTFIHKHHEELLADGKGLELKKVK